jgi:hypothetical protein
MSGDPALDALVAQTQAALGALITKPKLVRASCSIPLTACKLHTVAVLSMGGCCACS